VSAAPPQKFGRYTIVRELGRGAMGIVYLAEDSVLTRTVALKMIALTGSDSERDTAEARFRQEARAAGGISHPSIITIYDVGREGDAAFIAMELVEGRELRDLIREGEITASRAIEIAALVAEALAYAHERGVIHRDIKPGNIMVLADGRVKIMDFGIARLTQSSVKTQTGVLLGSPQYMAPEQIIGQPLDHRADIFSLGLVLYEMITGSKPFQGEDIPELTFKVANLPAAPPSHLAPDLPQVIDFIVARALKKRPDERYASAAEMAKDLHNALNEVRVAEAASAERGSAETIPNTPEGGGLADFASGGALREEPIELRASPRFDSSEGLARLAVLPSDEHSRSRGGWTVPLKREPQRVDRARAAVVLAYACAFIAAVSIAVFT